jgi:hypothetical protein
VPDNYPSGLSLLTYAVPNVAVPSQFTWALQYINYSNPLAPPALPTANAPTIGTYDSGWFGLPGAWTENSSGIYVAQIIAVPEPGSDILLLGGILTLWILTIRKRGSANNVFY